MSHISKAWYLKWLVWLIVAAVVISGIGAFVNPKGSGDSALAPEPTQSTTPTGADPPTEVAPLDLVAFLPELGIAVESVEMSARKAYIYLQTETTKEQAQQIAIDAMRYICDHAVQYGCSPSAASRMAISDGASPATPGYDVDECPFGFATDDVCAN